jgi:hypothetical protein
MSRPAAAPALEEDRADEEAAVCSTRGKGLRGRRVDSQRPARVVAASTASASSRTLRRGDGLQASWPHRRRSTARREDVRCDLFENFSATPSGRG